MGTVQKRTLPCINKTQEILSVNQTLCDLMDGNWHVTSFHSHFQTHTTYLISFFMVTNRTDWKLFHYLIGSDTAEM